MTRPWDDPDSDPLAYVETYGGLRAEGGLCAPLSATYTIGRVGFRPLPFWRGWWRRWDAGGPLIGHVTPSRHRLRFPAFTADRGGIRFITPPSEG